jgi:hypothetical protein
MICAGGSSCLICNVKLKYMNTLKQLLIWCLVLGTLVSCHKEDDPEPEPVSAAAQDYIPTTAKSTWSYGGTSPYTLTATGVTKVINGKTYHEMENKQGSTINKSYLLKENGVYTAVGLLPNTETLEIAILKENAPVGQSWEYTATQEGVDTKMKLSIVEKDISKTVEGKTYKNVIQVKMEYSYSFMGIDMGVVATSHYFFAKGVGLILSDLGDQGQAPLLTYDVK